MSEVEQYREWIGRGVEQGQNLSPWPAQALFATIRREGAPLSLATLPLLGHWVYFQDSAPQGALSIDGHPMRGGFMPPVDLPRRMWAGGRLEFVRSPQLGAWVDKRSTIIDVAAREGRSGRLLFVTVQHILSDGEGLLLKEEQDIVYRGAAPPGAAGAADLAPTPAPALAAGGWRQSVRPETTLLFRYSALTFNAHRIHYDRDYAVTAEGYQGLVVQGPLLATLLLDSLVRVRPDFAVHRFNFRALRPVFDTADFAIAGALEADGRTATLQVIGPDGALCMAATASSISVEE
jgi:3-methylfumaryl-CoA hydratase